jgi:hypothetical protein
VRWTFYRVKVKGAQRKLAATNSKATSIPGVVPARVLDWRARLHAFG